MIKYFHLRFCYTYDELTVSKEILAHLSSPNLINRCYSDIILIADIIVVRGEGVVSACDFSAFSAVNLSSIGQVKKGYIVPYFMWNE